MGASVFNLVWRPAGRFTWEMDLETTLAVSKFGHRINETRRQPSGPIDTYIRTQQAFRSPVQRSGEWLLRSLDQRNEADNFGLWIDKTGEVNVSVISLIVVTGGQIFLFLP